MPRVDLRETKDVWYRWLESIVIRLCLIVGEEFVRGQMCSCVKGL